MKKTILIYSVMILAFALSAYGLIDSLSVNYPPDDFYTNNQTPEFSFDIFGNTSTYNCTLYIDDLPYGNNESIVNGTAVMIANDTLLEGTYTWYVNCTDIDGTNTTGTRTINIDVTQPGIQMISTNIIGGWIKNQDMGGLYVVRVYFDSVMNESVFPNLTFLPNLDSLLSLNNSNWYNSSRVDYTYNINFVNLTEMDINLTVTNAKDLAGNPNNDNNTWTVILDVDTQEPLLSLDSISNNRRYNVSQLDLNYTVSGQEYCWYELDGELTNLTSCENTTLLNLTEGVHSFLLYANDTVNNVAYRSIMFYTDTLTPTHNYSISHSQISRANNSQEFVIELFWSEEMNQSLGPTLYFSPNISTILNSCGYYWIDSNNSIYNCTIYNIISYEQFDVNMTIFNASDLTGNIIDPVSYGGIIDIDMIGPQQTNYNYTPDITNNDSRFIGRVLNYTSGFNYTGAAINTTSCAYSLNYANGPWYYNSTAFNGTHCVFTDINTSGFNNSLHSFAVRIADLWGNNMSYILTSVFRDVSAPTTTASGNGYTFDTWTANPVNVTFTCDDTYNNSGCQTIYTCQDSTNTCSPSTIWNEPLNITTPGITYIRYNSVDNLNNTEVTKISRVMIIQNNTIYINESLNVTENETNIIIPEDNNNSNIYVPPDVNATLDFSERINISSNESRNVTLNGSINTTVNTTIIIIFEIPENITLSGNSSWLGNFNLPKLMSLDSVTITVTGYTVTKDIVVEIGADDIPIVLDKAVRIKLAGKSDKLLWHGSGAITTTCSNDTQEWADANLANDTTGHCKTIDGADLVLWTKHLSSFVTYTQAVDDDGGGGGGGGGNGGSSGGSSYVPPSNATTANPSVTYSYSLFESGTRIINVTHSQIPLYGMALTTISNISNVKLKITLIENPPVAQAETVYKYFQIDHETINDSIISGAKLQFKLAKSWLTENKVEKNQVVLYRYITGWNMLPTTIIKEDADSVYYESSSPGLSVFAIATKPKPPVTVIEPRNESQDNIPQENSTAPDIRGQNNSSNTFIIALVVIIIVVVLLYLFYAKKKNQEIKN